MSIGALVLCWQKVRQVFHARSGETDNVCRACTIMKFSPLRALLMAVIERKDLLLKQVLTGLRGLRDFRGAHRRNGQCCLASETQLYGVAKLLLAVPVTDDNFHEAKQVQLCGVFGHMVERSLNPVAKVSSVIVVSSCDAYGKQFPSGGPAVIIFFGNRFSHQKAFGHKVRSLVKWQEKPILSWLGLGHKKEQRRIYAICNTGEGSGKEMVATVSFVGTGRTCPELIAGGCPEVGLIEKLADSDFCHTQGNSRVHAIF